LIVPTVPPLNRRLIVLTTGTISPPEDLPMKFFRRFILLSIALFLLIAPKAANGNHRQSLSLADARRVMAAAVDHAKKGAGTAAIAIVDEGGNLMLLERLDNTFAAGANISIGKARTSALFKKPTKFFEDVINKGRTAMTALPDFTPLQGGVPIIVDGHIVGGIGVSGAASAAQDEEIALAGAAALSSVTAANSVSFFDKDAVIAAFAKGAVITDGMGANFQVHASRRIAPGQAEVHTRETDIIYVLKGEATFVTGGTSINPQEVAPNEFRGSHIEGGDIRNLSKGDIIIVPAGTPHWFKEVRGEFHYYVVKVS
jgi:glc operon protein GlcG